MRRGWSALLAVAIAGVAALGPAPVASGQEVTLSVAISMKEVAQEVGRRFAGTRPGVAIRYNLGASGDLEKQIEAGAPVDLFISAGERQMDELDRKGLIVAASRHDFARNVLVVVVPADSPLDLARPADLLAARVRRVAIGDPRTVPVGQYAQESLRALGLWDQLRPRLVFAQNVRQVLDWVARSEVDAGWVYATDVAVRAALVREAFRPPPDTYRPVVYPVAVVAASKHRALAEAFLALLVGPEGRTVLTRRGFEPATGGAE